MLFVSRTNDSAASGAILTLDCRLGVASAVAVGAMVASLGWFKLSSIDTGYHLAYGRHFLDTGKIVTLDPFLDPTIARPFVNANWGTQVLFALIERAAGASGLLVLRWVLLIAIFSSIAIIVRRESGGWHWTAWAWMLAGLAAYERFTLRPELLSYAVLALMLLVVVREQISWRSVIALGAMQAAWVNLHSYFLVGLIVTGSMLAGELLRRLTGKRPVRLEDAKASRIKMLALAVVVQSAACLANPWHVRGALFPIQTLTYLQDQKVVGAESDSADAGSWSIISEFRPPLRFLGTTVNYRTIDAYCVLLVVALLGIVALLFRGFWGYALLIAVFMVMSLQMRRNIAQFAVVAAPLVAVGLGRAMSSPWSARRKVTWPRRFAVAATILAALGWTWSIVDGRFYYAERRINREPGWGYSSRMYQADAAQWLSGQPGVQPQLFVDFFSSSNVLPWLDSRFKLLVDTNTFAYEDGWLREVIHIGVGAMDHRAFLDRHGVNAVLLHVGPDTEPLARALQTDARNWALVYVDPHAVVFVRRIKEHEALIAAHKPVAGDVVVQRWLESAGGLRYHRALSVATMGAVPLVLGWYEPAARLFEEALRLAPDSPAAWNNLGMCHGKLANAAYHMGMIDRVRLHLNEAVRCFGQAAALQPNDEVARANFLRAQESLRSIP